MARPSGPRKLVRRLARLDLVTQFTLVGTLVGLLVAGGVAGFVEARLTSFAQAQLIARAADQVRLGILERARPADFQPPYSPEHFDDLADRLGPVLAQVQLNGSGIIRLYVFDRDGTIIYSDLPQERSSVNTPAPGSLLADALRGEIGSRLSGLTAPENASLRERYGEALEVYVPVSFDGRIVGAYEIYHDLAPIRPIRPLVWSSVLSGFILLFLALLTVMRRVATQNARLFRAIERRAAEAVAVAEVGRAISSSRELQAVLELIVERARRLLHSDRSAIAVAAPAESGELFRFAAHRGLSQRFSEHMRPRTPRDGTTAAAIAGRRPAWSDDILNDPAFDLSPGVRAAIEAEGYRAVLSAPLVSGDRVLGALVVYRDAVGPFRPDEVQLLEVLADQAAIAMENARAFEELAQRNAELERANRLKSQFLATMSHELRTPMNSIIGYSQLMLDGLDGELTDDQRRDLSKVVGSAESLLNLINDILDLSKIEAGRLDLAREPLDLARLVQNAVETVAPLAQAKGLVLGAELLPCGPILGDGARLRQVLLNLLSNAVKFTDRGSIAVRLGERDGLAVLTVADTGIGIPAEAREYIFDEFRQVDGSTTRRHGGTGLGLAIARKLVELHGGRIEVDSQPGRGSTFSVVLPLAAAGSLPRPIRDDGLWAALQGLRRATAR